VKQSREHGLAGGSPVDGEAREFADAAAFRTQTIDVRAVELVGRQPFIGIRTDTYRSHDQTLVVGKERQYPTLPLANRYDVTSPCIFLLDQGNGIAVEVNVNTLGNPDFERTFEGRQPREGGEVRFGQREAAKSQSAIIENRLASFGMAHTVQWDRGGRVAPRALPFVWRRRRASNLSTQLPDDFADRFFQG
jgi:hypothetical protein